MNVRLRGIYSTALTELLRDEATIVNPSEPIRERFDESFDQHPPDVTVQDTDDRQGVGVVGELGAVESIVDHLRITRDAFAWYDAGTQGAVHDGRVVETLRSGAIVDIGDWTGFLPYGNVRDRVEEGDVVRVQVAEPKPPWNDDRTVLDTTVTVTPGLVTLTRDGSRGSAMAWEDLLTPEVPTGWGVRWSAAADNADVDTLEAALVRAVERSEAVEAALQETSESGESAPVRLVEGQTTAWVWFGRESRFSLDDSRRKVTTTMPGHHRIKAGSEAASAAVDFVEALCVAEGEFPFGVTCRQFGPTEGDRVTIGHGKPDGSRVVLGRGEVTDWDADGAVTVERQMSAGGTYDALGVERELGDVAVTKFREGRWWYPTVYRGEDGETRGTYVNICTPVEVFPETVRYVDLHVDVVKHADGTVERVDDDELDAAVEAGHVSDDLAAQARTVASKLEDAL